MSERDDLTEQAFHTPDVQKMNEEAMATLETEALATPTLTAEDAAKALFHQSELELLWKDYAVAEGLVWDMPNSSEKRAFMAGQRWSLNQTPVSDGFHVELGPHRFTQAQWETIETYAKGVGISRVQDELNDGLGWFGFGTRQQNQVAEFHRAFGVAVADYIKPLDVDRIPVRVELIREEFFELAEALGWQGEFAGNVLMFPKNPRTDIVETIDAAIDILYVVFGLLVEMGVDARPFFEEVQESNMSKLDENGDPIIAGENDPDGIFPGRVKKGPNYFKPDIRGVLADLQSRQPVRTPPVTDEANQGEDQ